MGETGTRFITIVLGETSVPAVVAASGLRCCKASGGAQLVPGCGVSLFGTASLRPHRVCSGVFDDVVRLVCSWFVCAGCSGCECGWVLLLL